MFRCLLSCIWLLVCLVASAQETRLIIPERKPCEAAALSPSEQWLVSISGTEIQVWEQRLGKLLKNIHIAGINRNNDQRLQAMAITDEHAVFQMNDTLYVLSLDDLEIRRRIKTEGWQTAITIGNAGKLYTAGVADEDENIVFREYDVAGQRQLHKLTIPLKNVGTHYPESISISAEGDRAILSDRLAGSWIVDLNSFTILKAFTKPADARPLRYLSNGEILALTGESSKSIMAVRLNPHTFIAVKSSATLFVDDAVSAFENTVINGHLSGGRLPLSFQGKTVVLNVNSLAITDRFDTPYEIGVNFQENSLILTDNGRNYLFAGDITKYSVASNTPLRSFGLEGFESFVQYIFRHSNGLALKDRTISFDNGHLSVRHFKKVNFEGAVYRLSADGSKGYVYSPGNGLATFDPTLAKPVYQKIDKVDSWKKAFVGMQVFDKHGMLALIGDDGIYVMDLKTFKLLYIVDIPNGLSFFLMEGTDKYCDISPDGSRMILYAPVRNSDLDRISCVDLGTKEEIWHYQTSFIRNLRFSDNGSQVVFTGSDTLFTLSSATGKPVRNPDLLPSSTTILPFTTVSPANRTIAIKQAAYDGITSPGDIHLYSFDQRKKLGVMPGTGDPFFDFVFLKDERYLLTVEKGGICIWDTEQKRRIGKLYLFEGNGEWVFISPDGRFDATPAALKTLYYVKGKEIIPLESLYEKFYTPGLLKQLWAGADNEPVPDVKKLKKAPKINVSVRMGEKSKDITDDQQEIEGGAAQAAVTVNADAFDDKISEIRLYQNGKLVSSTRNLLVEDDNATWSTVTKQFTVALLPGKNQLRAVALNTQRTESLPVEFTVSYKEADAVPQRPAISLYMVVIGLNNYKNPKYNLNYAQADARGFKDAFYDGAGSLFQNKTVIELADDKATKEDISGALREVSAKAKPEDLFVFYYAGHGVLNDKKDFFLVPYDVTQMYGNDNALEQKGLSALELQEFSKNLKAQKQLFILDACQSAGAFQNLGTARGAAEEKAIAQLARATGTQWLSASGSDQFASEFEQLGHGTFTYCILQAFSGEADSGDKKLTVKELDAYLQDKVPEITKKYKGTPQYPSSYSYGNDFPLIIIK